MLAIGRTSFLFVFLMTTLFDSGRQSPRSFYRPRWKTTKTAMTSLLFVFSTKIKGFSRDLRSIRTSRERSGDDVSLLAD
jgi:hypothetical protein